MSGWIGVDLDGTLAVYHGWKDGEIGPPVPVMLARVKRWLAEGKDVRIMTARVNRATAEERYQQTDQIGDWCVSHLGVRLSVTCCKDFAMIELWDDRAVQIEMNTGRRVDGKEQS